MKKTAFALSALLAFNMCGANIFAAHFSQKDITLDVGDTKDIRLEDTEGKVKYSISNSNVFTYDGNTVTAVGSGTAYLTAVNNGKKYTCTIVVRGDEKRPTTSGRSFDTRVSCGVGSTKTIYSVPTYNRAVSVVNADPDICTVSVGLIEDGVFPVYVKGRKKGLAYLTVIDASTRKELYVIRVECGGAVSGDGNVTDTYDDDYSEQYANEVIALVNEERRARGLNELERSDELCDTARIRATELGRRFSHTRPDGSKASTAVSVSYNAFGENIARDVYSPETVMRSWMNSSRHKGNILSDKYNKIGVAYDKNTQCWVQVFTD